MSDEYRPRPNDDLVEPLFGGIRGADEGSDGESSAPQPTTPRMLFTMLWLTALMGLGLYFAVAALMSFV